MSPETLVAAVFTLAIFSFLYRENPIYRVAEHILVGISVGYYLVILVEETILSKVVNPLFYDGRMLSLIPAILGIMMFSRLSRKSGWLARIPLAVLIGAGAGVSIPAMLQGRILKQMSASMLPLNSSRTVVLLVAAISTLS